MSDVPMSGMLRVTTCGLHRGGTDRAEMFDLLGKAEAIVAGEFNVRALDECDLPGETDVSNDKILRKLDMTIAGRLPEYDGVTMPIGIPA
ncbi:hypothetical protein [Actinomadura harenae]|uniref:Uncharacterized protein n=1 Tax=Actinomadura harenae TaxID=2483351 RepID=A0A3M2LME4_9ACTN|nr:hypothetical protein [Actinomadura harenae]RMI38622.1 hypothetical protein EBO15_32330 [Actinomadura harenae]